MKEYIVTDEDIEAINRLLDTGKNMSSISRDETEHTPFECGILSEVGYMPIAYGGGKTITSAINEALNTLPNKTTIVSQNSVTRAMAWLSEKCVISVTRH